ncbi:SusC/RagA family TonB-linked outer membrane protein [Pedobacter sandarakinus]|uniref:SusC/RagA family TonB-linked outer membrane protein n=1 Tax=Pedobacter sandarakinus TaxID=353156 RepID=UPI0022478DF7|nr:SusC/RagA family TonB-linked outer membrane protein [Pedobacter sandarakinus]MCX2574125.1 SusC/RagA family TonB-linked outer membrane protein [Pedobacter sandarakinus]
MHYCYLKKWISAFSLAALVAGGTVSAKESVKLNALRQTLVDVTISGTVTDPFGRPLQGVVVSVKGNPQIKTSTDFEGVFKLSVPKGSKIVVSYPGYYELEKSSDGFSNGEIRLSESFVSQPDTLNTLYGKVATANAINATSTVAGKQIANVPGSSYTYALAGRAAGLRLTQVSGFKTPYTGSLLGDVNIFSGIRTPVNQFGSGFTGNENTEFLISSRGQGVTIIIDGVQRDFTALDLENIESISIQKDAMSTIFLGQRSSRPILLVTTVKPVKGAPRMSFSAMYGIQSSLITPQRLKPEEYAYLYNEAIKGQNLTNPAVYNQADFDAFRNGNDPFLHPNVDWAKELLNKTAPTSRFNFNLNGGNKTAHYVVSLGYFNQEGLFKESSVKPYSTKLTLNRYTVNSTVDVNLTKNFNVALQLFGRIQDGNQPGANYNELLNDIYRTPSVAYPIYNQNGTYGGSNLFQANLYARAFASGYTIDYGRDVMSNLDLTYKFDDWVKGLYAKLKGNTTVGSTTTTIRTEAAQVYQQLSVNGNTIYNPYGQNSVQTNGFNLSSNYQFWYAQFMLGLDRTFGKHAINILSFADQRQALTNFDLPSLNTNIAGKVAYSYANKYFAEGALNYSGYDRIQKGNRFGLFYAVAGGWKLSEENFIKDNVSWIDLLKLKASFGKTGNNSGIGYFTYRHAFDSGQEYKFGGETTVMTPGLRELGNTLNTVNQTWEKAYKLNIAIDVSLFKNRLGIMANYYNDKYFDLLQQRGKSTSIIGLNYPNENIGINRFQGTEFELSYRNRVGNFSYFISANASIENSKIVFQDEIGRLYDANIRTGLPTNADFGYIANGLYQTDAQASNGPRIGGLVPKAGDVVYVDQNGDKIIDDFDFVFIGNTRPKIYYGTTIGFNFKGLDFNMLVQGVENNFVQTSDYTAQLSQNQQGFARLVNRWTPETASTATLPRLQIGGGLNYLTSTFWRASNNYLRIKYAEFGYNIPAQVMKKVHISGLRLFVGATNLATFAQYDLVDPEVRGYGVYPIQRTFNMGINLKL